MRIDHIESHLQAIANMVHVHSNLPPKRIPMMQHTQNGPLNPHRHNRSPRPPRLPRSNPSIAIQREARRTPCPPLQPHRHVRQVFTSQPRNRRPASRTEKREALDRYRDRRWKFTGSSLCWVLLTVPGHELRRACHDDYRCRADYELGVC